MEYCVPYTYISDGMPSNEIPDMQLRDQKYKKNKRMKNYNNLIEYPCELSIVATDNSKGLVGMEVGEYKYRKQYAIYPTC